MSDLHSPAAQLRLLLCSRLALPKDAPQKPLGPKAWSGFERALLNCKIEPAELLGFSAEQIATALGITPPQAENIAALLSRSGPLAVELEQLGARGIWVLTRGDNGYPQRWRTLLQDSAPVVIYGAGDRRLLSEAGIAVVGSRNVDDDAVSFARRVGECCASADLPVISGFARGIDQEAMMAAVSNCGHSVGILAEDLTRVIREPNARNAIEDGHLLLVSVSEHYSAPFSIGRAMERNAFIYTAAEAAVVVSASENTGGTWNGAAKNLRFRWVPIFVRAGEDIPPGNSALLKAGAHPIREEQLTSEFVATLAEAELPPLPKSERQPTLSFE